MAKKLPAYTLTDGTLSLTPTQFMHYKMKQRPADLIVRLGHFSLGVYGLRWSDALRCFIGQANDIAAQREYEDTGSASLEELEKLETSALAEPGSTWGQDTARDRLQTCATLEKALNDMAGRHPLDSELRAEIAAERAVYEAFLASKEQA
jgi:hypothetical protein